MDVGNLPNLRQSASMLEQALKNKEPGQTFSFDELNAMAGLDVRVYRSVVESVKKALLNHHGKLLTNLRGIGYRLSLAGEFHIIAKDYRKKSGKALKKSLTILNVADMSLMSEEDRFLKQFEKQENVNGSLQPVALHQKKNCHRKSITVNHHRNNQS